MLQTIIFYLFATVLTFSAVMVVTARNPVHSVLFLILAFFNAAGLFVLLGAEFVALILAIVYVGAVAVLFMFVVMMLDISFADLRKGAIHYVPLGLVLGGILLTELIGVYSAWSFAPGHAAHMAAPAGDAENTRAIGAILYTQYGYVFQLAGLVLLVAMIGAIVLTHRRRVGVHSQKVADQVARKPADVMDVKAVLPGQGA